MIIQLSQPPINFFLLLLNVFIVWKTPLFNSLFFIICFLYHGYFCLFIYWCQYFNYHEFTRYHLKEVPLLYSSNFLYYFKYLFIVLNNNFIKFQWKLYLLLFYSIKIELNIHRTFSIDKEVAHLRDSMTVSK